MNTSRISKYILQFTFHKLIHQGVISLCSCLVITFRNNSSSNTAKIFCRNAAVPFLAKSITHSFNFVNRSGVSLGRKLIPQPILTVLISDITLSRLRSSSLLRASYCSSEINRSLTRRFKASETSLANTFRAERT